MIVAALTTFARVAVLLSLVGASAAQAPAAGINLPGHRDKPYVILVSLDGFRADYLDRFQLPNLQRVMKRGVRAKWMNPVFPSFTFPNHYSLVTGLHPENHGIVANSFFDPARKAKYSMHENAATDGTWYRGEPIWVTAETQGMVAACFFWPGSEAAIKGVRPTFSTRYDEQIPNDTRVKRVLDWLQLPPERRPHVITLYFSELDSASHRNRVGSAPIERAARSLDNSVGLLLDGIDALPIRDRVNLLLTSDHGMVDTGRTRTIIIESLTDLSGVEQVFDGPVTTFHVAGGDPQRALKLRDRLNARLRHGKAYLRGDVPERFHYRADPRAGDVIVIMDESWTLRRRGLKPLRPGNWGMHGWDNALPSMRAIFVTTGPDVQPGVVVEPVDNVDVYPYMIELLGLRRPEGIDGVPGRIRSKLLGSDLDFSANVVSGGRSQERHSPSPPRVAVSATSLSQTVADANKSGRRTAASFLPIGWHEPSAPLACSGHPLSPRRARQ